MQSADYSDFCWRVEDPYIAARKCAILDIYSTTWSWHSVSVVHFLVVHKQCWQKRSQKCKAILVTVLKISQTTFSMKFRAAKCQTILYIYFRCDFIFFIIFNFASSVETYNVKHITNNIHVTCGLLWSAHTQ